ncbi:hypothetical protein [Pseudoruegeria sp. HB172150]|uniref:hypothetical protein n=1 Tax=Pseudoruegeria sp. HB172150 TaxID=2721164 RepID=UPI00155564F9|nr:hypothetical protein [Pseudoruegeria sp. HB172150]
MTALKEYQRLESPGVWRATPEDQRRDVIVSVGDATLVIYDSAGRPLTHWSLPALERQNPGLRPAIYRPGPDSPEDLELTAPEMIDAIERVRQAVEKRKPHRGRLRNVLLLGGLAIVLALLLLWLPSALIRHASGVLPEAKREELGERLLTEIRRVAGSPCTTSLGNRALAQLDERLLGGGGRIEVLPGGIPEAAHLPGGIILLNRTLVEDYEDPSVVAGYILAEDARGQRADAVQQLLDFAGPLAALRLLTTGDIPEERLAAYAETLMSAEPDPLPDAVLLERFAEADVPASPYAYSVDMTGEATVGLIEADPVQELDALPVLRDSDWVSLQGICGE